MNVDVTSELIRLEGEARRRAMSWDAAYELIRASVGVADSDRSRLVTQRVIEEIGHHVDKIAMTDDERRRVIAVLADPTATLITTTVAASFLAEQVAAHTDTLVDEAISRAVARISAMPPT